MSKKVIIIGSGIAGISSSLKLKSYGINSIILDKGNFIGGRISTREVKIASSSSYFFHGAQFFTAKTHEFKKIISTGVNGKYIKEFGSFDPKRYRGNKNRVNYILEIRLDFNTSILILLTSKFLRSFPFNTFPDGNLSFWELIFFPFSITS